MSITDTDAAQGVHMYSWIHPPIASSRTQHMAIADPICLRTICPWQTLTRGLHSVSRWVTETITQSSRHSHRKVEVCMV